MHGKRPVTKTNLSLARAGLLGLSLAKMKKNTFLLKDIIIDCEQPLTIVVHLFYITTVILEFNLLIKTIKGRIWVRHLTKLGNLVREKKRVQFYSINSIKLDKYLNLIKMKFKR